jgi:hypothetical protein
VSAFNFRVDEGLGEITVRCQAPTTTQIAQFFVQPSSYFADHPCISASFEVNLEPHTGARPSARLCVGLINADSNQTLKFFLILDVLIFKNTATSNFIIGVHLHGTSFTRIVNFLSHHQ